MTRDFTAAEARAAVLSSQADFFFAEAEVPSEHDVGNGLEPNPQAQDWPALVLALRDLPLKGRAVVTNFAPFVHQAGTPWAEMAAPLILDGWGCVTEVYAPEQRDVTAEARAAYAMHYTHEARPDLFGPDVGWYRTHPVFGCYSGEFGTFTLADYPTSEYGSWSAWDAGNVLPSS